MIIKTSDDKSVFPFLKKLYLPPKDSHKGINGQVLIIGGSSLFHAASLWSAEVASHFVDIVHYSSTKENNQVFLSLKKKFINGIIVSQKDIPAYVKEDDAILIGPGMTRGKVKIADKQGKLGFNDLINLKDEPTYTYYLTRYLIYSFPHKKFVFDAGALQMLQPSWLTHLIKKPILTPHQIEFEKVFKISVKDKSLNSKAAIVKETAKKYNSFIILKAISDIVSDGEKTVIIKGGNPGLSKGGTGDVLAGLIVSLFSKNEPFTACVVSSFLLKKTGDDLLKIKGYWYNINDIIEELPKVLNRLLIQKPRRL